MATNARAEQVLGYPHEQWPHDEGLWQRILHPDDRDHVLQTVRATIAAGRDLSLTYRVRAADRRWVWLHHLGHVARDDAGTATAMHSVLIDVTEAQRRERAAALLAAAGRALSGPGTVTQRLAAVAELAVGDLGQRATVWLRGDDGRYRPVAAAPAGTAPQVLKLAPVAAPRTWRPPTGPGAPSSFPRSMTDCCGSPPPVTRPATGNWPRWAPGTC
ncbi:hypothetical protein GCM10027451_49040 [Geodermatophilus aquaeductus]|uniref:histidine kinase n=1 Tax=Geodermatophilus aquaeductus TaxID=1564161 RepID=A0A521FTN3_9ACTN|nr:PAS domain-containing protein [Geodermatophilus aquaeductus]SMO99486.1 PAS domain S-box-containing protein [Geodermatophilus aquaeductus]